MSRLGRRGCRRWRRKRPGQDATASQPEERRKQERGEGRGNEMGIGMGMGYDEVAMIGFWLISRWGARGRQGIDQFMIRLGDNDAMCAFGCFMLFHSVLIVLVSIMVCEE